MKVSNQNQYLPLATLIFIGLIFFAPVMLGGKSLVDMSALIDKAPWSYELSLPQEVIHAHIDGVANYYPMLKGCIIPSLTKLQIPTWCPSLTGGYPIFANSDARVLAWTNWLYFFLSPERGFTYSIIIQFFLLLFFSYLYFRQLKISDWGSVVASLSLGFSNILMNHLTETWFLYSLVWLPLILYLIEKFQLKPNYSRAIFISIISALVWYGGHPQIAFYIIVFSWAYFVWRLKIKNSWFKSLVWPTAIYLVTFLLIAWQFLPLFELQSLSHRQIATEPSWISPVRILTSIWPELNGRTPEEIREFANLETSIWDYFGFKQKNIDNSFYIGFIPLILAIIAFRKKWSNNKYVKFFGLSSLSLFLVQTTVILWKPLFGLLPFINRLERTGRLNIIIIFGFSYLAGVGFDYMSQCPTQAKQVVKKLSYIFVLLSLIFILGFTVFNLKSWHFFFDQNYLADSIWATIFGAWPNLLSHFSLQNHNIHIYFSLAVAALLLIALRAGNKLITTNNFKLLTIILVSASSVWFGRSMNNLIVPKNQVYPDISLIDFLKKTEGNKFYRVASLNAPKIMYNNTFLAYNIADIGVEITMYPKWYSEYFTFAEHRNLEKIFDNHLWITEPKTKLLDIFNVKYFLTTNDKNLDENKFQQVYADSKLKIFKNKRVFPRVWLTYNTITAQGERALEIINSEKFNPKTTALIASDQNFILRKADAQGQAKIIKYEPASVTVQTKSLEPSFLVLADTYYPGWKVSIDGQASKIYKTNYISRGVYLPAGKHQVVFYFDSNTIKQGFTITTTTTLIITLFFCFLALKRLKYR